MKKLILLLSLFPLLTGCPYPARTVMPLKSQVIDAETGLPIEKATVLRVVCDIHDSRCVHGQIEKAETNKEGRVELEGKRKWGLWFPAPGGLPVPSHQIAIWKAGYQAFVFSQYGDISDIESLTKRDDIKKALQEIPQDRKSYSPSDKPEEMFEGGKINLHKAQAHN